MFHSASLLAWLDRLVTMEIHCEQLLYLAELCIVKSRLFDWDQE